METLEAMRTTGTCRHYKPEPVPDELLMRAFDVARFAPQGGNRQPVRWVVVRDADAKRQLRDWYLPIWKRYLQGVTEGAVQTGIARASTVEAVDRFAENLHEVPAIVVACAELDGIHPTDAELGRVSIVGGASVYPTVQNFCLACRDLDIGTAITTLLCLREPDVKELLGIPDGFATACHIAVGFRSKPWPRKLTRLPVEEIVHFDRWDGAAA